MSGELIAQALLSLLAVIGTLYLGFVLLALSQDRHWHEAGGQRQCPPRMRRMLRPAGYALLIVALVLALMRDGASFGALLWATTISAGAFAVVCTLTWRPRWLRPLVRLLYQFG